MEVLMENNQGHFTGRVMAQWDEHNIVREIWSLSKSKGDTMAWGKGLALPQPALSLRVDSQASSAASTSNFESHFGVSGESVEILWQTH